MRNDKNTLLLVLVLAAMLFSLFTVFIYGNSELGVSAKAATLYEPQTKQFIFQKNMNDRLPMASTTKIMTALLAIENCDLKEYVTTPKEACGVEGSSIYLKEGDSLTVEDLVYSVLLQSANDAATVLAYKIGGDIKGFADMMNARAEHMGLSDTNFENPHGLDSENHYTTAHDLAIIAAEALNNDIFRKISSTYKYSFKISDAPRIVVNHNKLLKRYDGAIGVKTGYTKKCGRCLVGAAEKEGVRLVSVTLNSPDDWNDHTKLLDYGFEMLERVSLSSLVDDTFSIPLLGGSSESIKLGIKAPEKVILIKRKSEGGYSANVELPKYIAAPVKKGDTVGRIRFIKDGVVSFTADVIALEDALVKKEKHRGLFPFLK